MTIYNLPFYLLYTVAGATGVALRLVGGPVPWAGTVQMVVNGISGTICSTNAVPDPNASGAANVSMAICRDQGYAGVLRTCK